MQSKYTKESATNLFKYLNKDLEPIKMVSEVIKYEKKPTKQFSLGLSGHITLNPNAMKKLGIAATLYLVLIQLRVKKEYQEKDLKIYERYWKKGLLATAVDRGYLCKRLGIAEKKTITRRAYLLEKHGIIKTDWLHPSECFDNQQHKVYILGTYDKTDGEHYYIYDL